MGYSIRHSTKGAACGRGTEDEKADLMNQAGKTSLLHGMALCVFCLLCSRVYADYTTLVDNGPVSNRVNMVFLGDGYQAGEELETIYPQHIDVLLHHMFEESEDPFPRYESFFNVHRIDVVSEESGADIPNDGVSVDTALNATYSYDGSTDRLLYISSSRANNAMRDGLSGSGFTADLRVVTVNSSRYGGGGGSYAVYAGANRNAAEIALHEMGHQFANLADEYATYNQPFNGTEPSEANVTTDPRGSKWGVWLGYQDPDHPEMGTIGVYEGGKYYAEDIYRPSLNSKMRSLGRPFDAVSREQIIARIYEIVDPIDSFASNSERMQDPGPLWVDVIDCDVLDISWSVNGIPQAVWSETFDPTLYGYGLGTFTVQVDVRDNTDWIRTESIQDLASQQESWTVTLSQPAQDLDGTGALDDHDLDLAFQRLAMGAGFDLDGSGVGDAKDLDFLITTMLGTAYGDANLDGSVDLLDLSELARSFGDTGQGWAQGNFNGDSSVDLLDLSLLAASWGSVADVPEPVSLLMMSVGLGWWGVRRRAF